MNTAADVEQWIYASYMAAKPYITTTLDEEVRRPELTRAILAQLGSPDRSSDNVLITGSKGKGSTAVMIADILRAHGCKVGLFTSPHLIRFTERIRLNGLEIPEETFVRLGNEVKAVVDPLTDGLAADEYFGPVGLAAVIAALYFQEQKTDMNIWECGRGALYDDVNQIHHQFAVITPIIEEHRTYLGPTVADIVRHKLGVVTSSVDCISIGRQDRQTYTYIEQQLNPILQRNVVRLGTDVLVSDVQLSTEGTTFNVRTPYGDYEQLELPLLGAFQADNAALALASAEQIMRRRNEQKRVNVNVTRTPMLLNHTFVQKALVRIEWPGRLQLLARDPAIVLDGTIHRQSAEHVARMLDQINKTGVLIMGIPQDKDYVGVAEVLAPLARHVIVTAANHDYLKFPTDAVDVAKRFCSQVEFIGEAAGAFQAGLDKVESDEWLAIVGTQSLIGEAQKFFKCDYAKNDRSTCRQ